MGSVYWDERRNKSGKIIREGAWAIKYADVDGRIKKERVGENKTLARRTLAQRETQVDQARLLGLPTIREYAKPKAALSVRQYIEKYLEHVKTQCALGTHDRYQTAKPHLLRILGDITLRQVKKGDIHRFVDKRLQEGAMPWTVRLELALLSGMFSHAAEEELLETNPVSLCRKIRSRKLRITKVCVRYLEPEEEARLLAACPDPDGAQRSLLKWAILLSIHTGARDKELCRLKWADVDLEHQRAIFRKTKNGNDRAVDLSNTALNVLEVLRTRALKDSGGTPAAIRDRHVFVNPDTGTPYTRWNNNPWRAALKKAGVTDFRWHDLRHTFGSRLAQRGISLPVIKELMGHASIQQTLAYAHLSPDNKRQAVKVLDFVPAAGNPAQLSHTRSIPAG